MVMKSLCVFYGEVLWSGSNTQKHPRGVLVLAGNMQMIPLPPELPSCCCDALTSSDTPSVASQADSQHCHYSRHTAAHRNQAFLNRLRAPTAVILTWGCEMVLVGAL